ncbi:LysR family transcriptional regulator [Brucella pseudogrignonensis]|uniref:DNA-binding transcriptional LysR family regulator n=1 Tax=Brucella pseudogrignonensis TaxID=419475 RepID=A0ABU1MDR3_9HYPH|nr:LysR family transcriptional regulator [Brucella pseudogrignonensis]MDR6434185.1 DNA-binding transcriptional LysR family regulator [Brucella pseudogrignonensis]
MELIGNINLKLLQTFLLVASEGSFRIAAEKLHRSHSAVSMQIKQLELQLGAQLFERTTRSIKLTFEGEKLRESSNKALYEIQLGLRQVREFVDFKRGRLSVASSSNIASIHLPPILTEFIRDYPEVTLSIRELTSRELFDALRRKEVDFAIGPQLDDDEFSYTTILHDPIQALIPTHMISKNRRQVSWEEIVKLPLLLPSNDTAMRRLVDDVLEKLGLSVETRYQFIHAETIIAMAEAGLGASVQPASRLKTRSAKSARVLQLNEPTISRKMALIKRKGQILSPTAQSFADKIIAKIAT